MRLRSRVLAWGAYAVVAFGAVAATTSLDERLWNGVVVLLASGADAPATGASASAWYREARPHCTPDAVEDRMAAYPRPAGMEGAGYAAACWSLAGRNDRARELITGLQGRQRWMAAGVLFDAVHDIADGGDELTPGPAMELVVEFWPNHYQALYHAGAARFQRGDRAAARDYLSRFLDLYRVEDAFRRDAVRMLEQLDEG